jgi:hypothetical protein
MIINFQTSGARCQGLGARCRRLGVGCLATKGLQPKVRGIVRLREGFNKARKIAPIVLAIFPRQSGMRKNALQIPQLELYLSSKQIRPLASGIYYSTPDT